MLDEYAKNRGAAHAALDQAEEQLPGSFDIARERAKIAWRADEYAAALEQLLALEPRMAETEPYDAAFALREAATSASELGQWSEAARLYARARDFAVGSDGDMLAPIAVGLAADGAVALFRSGGRLEAIRAMADVLDALAHIDPEAKLTARSVHLVVRHLILWMQSEYVSIELDGGAVHFPIGAASNPDPKKAMATLSVAPLAPVWQTLAAVSLNAGLEASEILAWPGLIAARKDPLIDALFRSDLLRHAIKRGDLPLFHRALIPALEAYQHLVRIRASDAAADPLQTTVGVIDPLSPADLASGAARNAAREAAIAFALVDCAKEPPVASRIDAVHSSVMSLIGVDAIPEWARPPAIGDADTSSIVASGVAALGGGGSLSPQQTFMTHLRTLEWARRSNYLALAAPALASLVRRTWSHIAREQRAFLLTPALSVPAIENALASGRSGMAFVAELLLAAEQAVSVKLSADLRELLRTMVGS
jgi:hypothetical protein